MVDKTVEQKVVVKVEDLFKIYKVGDEKIRALDGVSFEVFEGEFIAIVGTSGSGKSTLLNMLAGLEPPTKGVIRLGKKRIEGMKEKALVGFRRRNLGFIFQSYNLIGTMDALGNVALPLTFRGVTKKEREKKAMEMLDLVGIKSHARHIPSQMSGGQQQRVGIARALVSEPRIIFADEPTGNLDSATTKEVLELLRKMVNEKGKTLIMVTHDKNLARVADRIIHIKDGKIRKIEVNEKKEIVEDEDY